MERKKIDGATAQRYIDEERKMVSVARSLSKMKCPQLHEYAGEIVALAKSNKASKENVSRVIKKEFGLIASPDQVYRFVLSVLGFWPNSKKQKAVMK